MRSMTTLAAIGVLAVLTAVLVRLRIRQQDFLYRDVLLFAITFTIPLRSASVLTLAGGNVRLGDIILLLALVAAALEWLIVDRRVPFTQIDFLILAFVLWCFCTLAWSLDRPFGVTRAIAFVRDLMLYGVVAYWSRSRFLRAFHAAGAGVLGSFVYLFASVALRLAGSETVPHLTSGHAWDLRRFRGVAGIGGLTFEDGSVLMVAVWTYIAIFFWLARGGWMAVRRTERVLFVLVLSALAVLEIATFARGEWLGLAAGIACWVVWIGPEPRRKLLVPAAVLVAACLLTTYKLNLVQIVVNRVASFTAADKAIDERFGYWSRSLDALERRPMGVGLGGTNGLIDPEHRIWFVHNLYLQLLADLGPIGLGLVLGVFALALEKTIVAARAMADWQTRLAAASLAAALVAYLVTGMTYLDFSDLVIWLLIALASAVPSPGSG
jgi:O-antigen ligase